MVSGNMDCTPVFGNSGEPALCNPVLVKDSICDMFVVFRLSITLIHTANLGLCPFGVGQLQYRHAPGTPAKSGQC